jgi:hypothetical protein
MRPLVCATAAAAVALCGLAVPAEAATVVYGWAWSDGEGHLRVVPLSATRLKQDGQVRYKLNAVSGAKEVRLDYSRASYGRVTTACDLTETEGRVALGRDGLGRTACGPADLTATLGRGAAPLRVEYQGSKAVKVSEFLLGAWPTARGARGTVRRINDTTVLFSGGGKDIKLGYAYTLAFHRTTARCGDRGPAGKAVNTDGHGLGTKICGWTDFTKALRSAGRPIKVKIDYTPDAGGLNEVWELAGDA